MGLQVAHRFGDECYADTGGNQIDGSRDLGRFLCDTGAEAGVLTSGYSMMVS